MQHWLDDGEPRVLILDALDRDFKAYRRRLDYRDAIDEFSETRNPRGHYIQMARRCVADWGGEMAGPKFRANCRDYASGFFDALVDACPPGSAPINVRGVVDELSLAISANSKAFEGSSLEAAVLQGRRMGISLVLATQRAMRIPSAIRSEITDFLCFNASLERDKEVYEEMGWPEAYEGAQQLRRGECYYINTGMPE